MQYICTSSASGNSVEIAGAPCAITAQSTTQITCTTGSRSPSILTKVTLRTGGSGIATQVHFKYFCSRKASFTYFKDFVFLLKKNA